MSEKDKKQQKKTYQKPSLRAIELVADEVLAVGCKTQQTPNVGNSRHCMAPVGCASKGS